MDAQLMSTLLTRTCDYQAYITLTLKSFSAQVLNPKNKTSACLDLNISETTNLCHKQDKLMENMEPWTNKIGEIPELYAAHTSGCVLGTVLSCYNMLWPFYGGTSCTACAMRCTESQNNHAISNDGYSRTFDEPVQALWSSSEEGFSDIVGSLNSEALVARNAHRVSIDKCCPLCVSGQTFGYQMACMGLGHTLHGGDCEVSEMAEVPFEDSSLVDVSVDS